MATPIPCDLCGRPAAEFVITMQGTGDVTGVGVECLAAFAEAVVAAVDAAAAAQADEIGPPAAGWADPPDMAVIGVTDGPDGPQAAPQAPDGDWEAGYPQGPPAGRSDAGDDLPGDDREDSEAAAAADVHG